MVRLRWTPARLAQTLLLPIIGVTAVAASLAPLTVAWRRFFTWAMPLLGLPGGVAERPVALSALRFSIPFPAVDAAWPDPRAWLIVGILAAVLLIASLVLPSRFLPMAYFLRALVLIQGVAMLWFGFASPPFPYPLDRYLGGLLGAGLVVLALVPVLLGFTFYLLDLAVWRKVLLTVLALGHLAVLLPLQILVHAWLIHQGSLLVQPVLFLVFGILVQIMAFVAFYSWGMSWPGEDDERARTGA